MSGFHKEPLTPAEYAALQTAYDFFNRELFDQSLPQIMLTLQRRTGAHGYFANERFTSRDKSNRAHELAMNPDHFGRPDQDILSTLVHEMVHVWQYTHGKPGRHRYHNREWGVKMKQIGLYPSSTGNPGGKETGDRISHFVINNGPFERKYSELKQQGFGLRWHSYSGKIPSGPSTCRNVKTASKTRFSCPECFQNAWAKPRGFLLCGECYNKYGRILYMVNMPPSSPSKPNRSVSSDRDLHNNANQVKSPLWRISNEYRERFETNQARPVYR